MAIRRCDRFESVARDARPISRACVWVGRSFPSSPAFYEGFGVVKRASSTGINESCPASSDEASEPRFTARKEGKIGKGCGGVFFNWHLPELSRVAQ